MTLTLWIAEEKDELTYIEEFYILVDGVEVRAEMNSSAAASIVAKDGDYLTLAEGKSQEFCFRLPETFAARQRVAVSVVVLGYYVPLELE